MDIYIVTLVILGLLAVTDLTVGVANDAVNFLNSGVGSKAAPFNKILLVAALGVLVGVFFSSGMMDVAKTGIFNPQYFVLSEVLLIFVAVMFTDLLLLDLFNTFGLPTSTTVSVVAGMFGSALIVSLIKINTGDESLANLAVYLNIASLFKIFSAILISIAFAFIFGFLVQYITRMIFTFDYKAKFRRYGSLWGGVSLTVLSYFIIMKGAKSATFLVELGATEWMFANIGLILIGSMIFWTILFQLIIMIFKNVNILKFIVLLGTFSLSMSFAANDLVNFIGPPLAGLTAYFIALSSNDINNTLLGDLATTKVRAETWMLLSAGAVMVLTLYLSKKTRTVIQTEVGLGRQSEGEEEFDSNLVARAVVKMVISLFDFLKKYTPVSVQSFLSRRFDISAYKPEIASDGTKPSFDLLRASVILIVSSGLISFATSLKLPLSTTYVTFIVAMAAALPDKSWGRDSAVYRVAGVITVISGWFFTAFMAALISATIALIIFFGQVYGLGGMVIFTAFILFRTSKFHKQKESEKILNSASEVEYETEVELNAPGYNSNSLKNVVKESSSFLNSCLNLIVSSYGGLVIEDLKIMKKAKSNSKKINRRLNAMIKKTVDFIKLESSTKETELYLLNLIALSQDITDKTLNLTEQNCSYLDNNHNKLFEEQRNEIKELTSILEEYSLLIGKIYKNSFMINLEDIQVRESNFRKVIEGFRLNQINRIKNISPSMKRTILVMNIFNDIEGIGIMLLKVMEISLKLKSTLNLPENSLTK
jgi:phosphate/sulfate permease